MKAWTVESGAAAIFVRTARSTCKRKHEPRVVKMANHGVGRVMTPSSGREVTEEETQALRAFTALTFPALDVAPIAKTRVCVYSDTSDRHFWIAPDPERAGLVVAAGGSGHAFKFAPLAGGWIADAVEGKGAPRFRWRPEALGAAGEEHARHSPAR